MPCRLVVTKKLALVIVHVDDEVETYTCGICNFVFNDLRECPRCKFQTLQLADELEGKVPGLAPRPLLGDATITSEQVIIVLETISRIMVSDNEEEFAGHNASWFADAADMLEYWLGK